jgi:acetate kinase
MADHVLTLNAGSSSVKFALYPAGRPEGAPRLSGIADGLGSRARLRVRDASGSLVADGGLPGTRGSPATHDDALQATLGLLGEHAPDVRVAAVGHRIVHGGVEFDHPVTIDEAVLARLAALAPLAPLHQPHNLEGVHAARHAFPDVPQVACFDTAFHRAQPELNQRFALPRALHDEGVRRYGFHGLSYESICAQLAARGLLAGRVVAAHLGHGASLCAIRDGRSVATTMSFSPLDGLPMGTRCGRLDAAVVLHLLQQRGMAPERIARLLYRESGLLGLSGITGEMRELAESPEPAAREAVDYYVEHACRELAAMSAALDGIDRLVFTGGIGQNAAAIRGRIVERLGWMGLALDAAANDAGAELVSAPDSAAAILVLATDEEAVIARQAARFVDAR